MTTQATIRQQPRNNDNVSVETFGDGLVFERRPLGNESLKIRLYCVKPDRFFVAFIHLFEKDLDESELLTVAKAYGDVSIVAVRPDNKKYSVHIDPIDLDGKEGPEGTTIAAGFEIIGGTRKALMVLDRLVINLNMPGFTDGPFRLPIASHYDLVNQAFDHCYSGN